MNCWLKQGVSATVLWIVAVASAVEVRCDPASPASGKQIWKRHTIDNSSRGADGVRLADVNGDGLMDLTTGWEEGGVIRVYLNPGPKRAKRDSPH